MTMSERWPTRWFGVALAAVAAIVVIQRAATDTLDGLWWVSCVALLVAVAGLLIRSTLYISTALTMIGVTHTMWLLDAAAGLTTGFHPFGATSYLHDADVWKLIATSYHVFLLPMLLWVTVRLRAFDRNAFVASIIVFFGLSMISRFVLDDVTNVNYAHAIFPNIENAAIARINRLSAPLYLLILNASMVGVLFLPVTIIMRRRFPAPVSSSPTVHTVSAHASTA
jgi:hypothetical protein